MQKYFKEYKALFILCLILWASWVNSFSIINNALKTSILGMVVSLPFLFGPLLKGKKSQAFMALIVILVCLYIGDHPDNNLQFLGRDLSLGSVASYLFAIIVYLENQIFGKSDHLVE